MATPGYQDPHTARSAAETVQDEGQALARSATDSTKQVAQTVKDEASNVASELSTQARSLTSEATDQVRGQVDQQRHRAADALRTTGDELSLLADKAEHSRLTTELTRQIGSQVRTLASYLERTNPADALDQARSFARRRPGTFLLAAGLAGVITGRLIKSAAAGGLSTPSRDTAADTSAQFRPPAVPGDLAASGSASIPDTSGTLPPPLVSDVPVASPATGTAVPGGGGPQPPPLGSMAEPSVATGEDYLR